MSNLSNEMQLSAELFEPADRSKLADTVVVRPSLTYWQDAWQRLRKNIPAMVSLAIIIILLISCIVIPNFYQYTYDQQIRTERNQFPSSTHIFGTDSLGRDLFIRVVFGARISLSIGLVSSLINLTIGVLYGGISGYLGGKVDTIMMRIIEIVYSIPLTLYVILLQVVFQENIEQAFRTSPLLAPFKGMGSQLILVYIVLGIIYWIPMARVVRGQVTTIKSNEYVMAAQAQGAGSFRIILKHLVPNSIGQIIVMVTLSIPTAIFTESFLSFIGLGVSAPMASWGSLASESYKSLQSYPFLLFFPAMAICITMLAFNILGDGLRDALDPKLKK